MADVTVEPASHEHFLVEVKDGGTSTHHSVTVPDSYFQNFKERYALPQELVRASFEFLLAREPKESILREFSLEMISRYFPEYEQEITSA